MHRSARFDLVLLDRDGVINHDSGEFVKSAGEWHPIAGSLEAIVALQLRNIAVAVCTNQSGVARGLIREGDLALIHASFQDRLLRLGGRAIPVYYCPHAPDDGCACRKPAPGMLLTAMHDLGCEAARTCFVGDSERDLLAARRAGCEPVLVRTGNGRTTERAVRCELVFDDLAAWCRHLGAA